MTDLRTDNQAIAALAATLGPTTPAGPARSYAVLPSTGRPRYLVPPGRGPAAATRLRPGRSRPGLRRALDSTLRLGGLRLWPSRLRVPDGTDADPSLRRWLAARLGEPGLELAVALGRPRPNRKPVLQLIGPDGSTIGFAKVAMDDHTGALVTHEAGVLVGARPAPPLVLPPVLLSEDWRGQPVLVLGDIDPPAVAGDLRTPAAVLLAIASLEEVVTEPVVDGRWWRSVEARAAEARDEALLETVAATRAHLTARTWRFGRWHGDFAPWNAVWQGDRLLVWDWERSAACAPLGFDLLHNLGQMHLLVDGEHPEVLAAALRTEAGPTLTELGVAADDHLPLVLAYLLELRVRWAVDATAGVIDAKHGQIAEELALVLAQAVAP